MNDLNALLDRAAGPGVAPVDARADLTRGRRALSRVRRRRGAAGLAGVAAAGVIGVGVEQYATRHASVLPVTTPAITHGSGSPSTEPSTEPTVDPTRATDDGAVEPIVLLAQPTSVGAFGFDQVPQGWAPQAAPPGDPGVAAALGVNLVTFATADEKDTFPEDFLGKLVVMFNKSGTFGEKREYDGRTFWVNTDGGGPYTQLYVHTRPGEPEGVLDVQYPDHTGWTQDDMIAFLDGIHVGPGAEPNTTGG